jgi:CHASE2 domain-containing sensor protein
MTWGSARRAATPSDKVAVIAIDKQSLDNIGRWPWSREIMADMVDKLAAAKAKVIATTVFYSEPQRDQGLVYINKLIETCGVTLPTPPTPAVPAPAPTAPAVAGEAPAPVAEPAPAPPPSSCPQIESIADRG